MNYSENSPQQLDSEIALILDSEMVAKPDSNIMVTSDSDSARCTLEKNFNLWKCNNNQQCQVEGIRTYDECISG